MSKQRTILVIGATGHVGACLVPQLLREGAAVRALTRRPDSGRMPAGARVVRGDLSDPGTLEEGLEGADAAYLVWPFLTAEAAPGVLDLVKHHVRRIVYQSAMTVRDDAEQQHDTITAFHAAIERLIEQSGLEWTFLRCGGFAANTLGWAPQIRAEGVVRWPYGAAARSLIHERDIAAVAARVLTGEGHTRAKYVLTGPAAVTQVEQVRLIGEAIGRPLRFEEMPRENARQYALIGWPAAAAEGALDYWQRLVTDPEPVTSTVGEITGAPAHTFREWAVDHAADFRPPSVGPQSPVHQPVEG